MFWVYRDKLIVEFPKKKIKINTANVWWVSTFFPKASVGNWKAEILMSSWVKISQGIKKM